MPNPYRGEIEACLDGKSFRLCLTLSALAELEHTFGHEDMLALAERFQSGRLSAHDAQRIIGAGLRGAGHEVQDDAVGRMQTEGGAAGFVDIVARLLGATFGGPAAAIVGTLAGEMVSDLIGEKKSATEPQPPTEFPSPSCRRHVSDMTRGGVRGGGEPTAGGESNPDVRPGGSDTVPFPGTR